LVYMCKVCHLSTLVPLVISHKIIGVAKTSS